MMNECILENCPSDTNLRNQILPSVARVLWSIFTLQLGGTCTHSHTSTTFNMNNYKAVAFSQEAELSLQF